MSRFRGNESLFANALLATPACRLATASQAVAEKLPGVDQYAVLKAAEAFEAIPRLLAESAGLNATGKGTQL